MDDARRNRRGRVARYAAPVLLGGMVVVLSIALILLLD
jgi:hypothetical protein